MSKAVPNNKLIKVGAPSSPSSGQRLHISNEIPKRHPTRYPYFINFNCLFISISSSSLIC
jgi:hypothetical protein